MFSASPSQIPPPEKTILRCQDIVARFGISRSKIYELMNQKSPRFDGSMPFCVELDNLKDTDAPIHQPAAMLVAAD